LNSDSDQTGGAAESATAVRRGRGLCLLSGGLDSQLAVCVLRAQGVSVEGVVFSSPFFKISAARQAAETLGLTLHIVDFTHDIVGLVLHPAHGFGGALNPCIDCHALMIRRAGEMMTEKGFDFVATGEVLNQRPMSQNRRSLGIVEKDSALGGRLVRPLSALLLEPTQPETEGLIDRTRLLGLSGRTRKPQMALAAQYGLKEYPSPAGGCLLTEKGFCRKLADMRQNEGLESERLLRLLLCGRHFRLPGGAKCVAGRDSRDNMALRQAQRENDILLHTVNVPGPTALIPCGAGEEDVALAAGICAAYGDHGDRNDVTVKIIGKDGAEERVVAPLAKELFLGWML